MAPKLLSQGIAEIHHLHVHHHTTDEINLIVDQQLAEQSSTSTSTTTTTTTDDNIPSIIMSSPLLAGSSSASAAAPPAAPAGPGEVRKLKKKKVLLMGKSGSGKSSMRSIIFSNYVAVDTRRLGATIDIDLSHVKFLGNLTLNIWDCGGQEAFMENYINQQRVHVFSNVGVLIYVFDIESRDVDRDLATYVTIVTALAQYSPGAKVFVLIHKMDLIMHGRKELVFDERVQIVRHKTAEALANIPGVGPNDIEVQPFATSIWDQSLYKAWSSIIHDLVPNLSIIERELEALGLAIEAEEIILYERTSFLAVSSWTSEEGALNPVKDRQERLSNVMKHFKTSLARWSGTSRNSDQFKTFTLKVGTVFAFCCMCFTTNTYIQLVLPPGEARFNAAVLNTKIAASHFERLDIPVASTKAGGSGSASAKSSDTKDATAVAMANLNLLNDSGYIVGDRTAGGPSSSSATA